MYRNQRQPLLSLEEDDPDFVSYDDDELQAASRLKNRRKKIKACMCMTIGVVLVALVGVGLFFGTNTMQSGVKPPPKQPHPPLLGKYKHAAVASDVTLCSQIGRDIMKTLNGNAVDAALATLLCMGLADPQSMGIGGGFFMTVYNRTTGKSHAIDARETAPSAATEDMYYGNASSSKGGLSIAIPGEIRGYEMAYRKFGSLSWSDLFKPAIDMAQNGFKVPQSMAEALQDVYDTPDRSALHNFNETYINKDTGTLYKKGETIKLPKLANTLRTISEEGADAFYNGSLHMDIIEDMRRYNSGAIITADDLYNYKPSWEENAKSINLTDNLKIFGPTAPSSGTILMFILNILDGYNITSKDLETKDGKILVYHRIIEAFKFAYAKRTNLGDLGDPVSNSTVYELLSNLTSRKYADGIRAQIWDNSTHPVDYYGPTFYHDNKTSTAHLSVVDQHGNAVSVTSTVNARFGSSVLGEKTGIVFNDEMDDFATSNKPNDFGIYPSPNNKIKPGKRPLSSMCPAIFVDGNDEVKLVLGAAGGSRITTATAYVAARVLWFGENIKQAIDALRLHHQLLPDVVSAEVGFDQTVIQGLRQKGHNVTTVTLGRSIVQGIHRSGDYLYANSDFRKGGTPDGF